MLHARVVAVTLALAIAPLGCHSSSPTGVAPVALEGYCDAVADSVCARLVGCCPHGDATLCHAVQRAACAKDVAAHQAAHHVYDGSAAGACLAGAPRFYDGCTLRNDRFWSTRETSDACTRVWGGTVPPGGACKVDVDCATQSGSRVGCVRKGGAIDGTCAVVKLVPSGSRCSLNGEPFADCTFDSYCRATTSAGDAGVPSSTCVVPGKQGDPCDPLSGYPPTCDDGLFCENGSKRCRPPAAEGERCDGGTPCAAGLFCPYPSLVCRRPAAVGAACDIEIDPRAACVAGASCDRASKACVALKKEGEPCSYYSECESGSCYGTCRGGGVYTSPECAQITPVADAGAPDSGPTP